MASGRPGNLMSAYTQKSGRFIIQCHSLHKQSLGICSICPFFSCPPPATVWCGGLMAKHWTCNHEVTGSTKWDIPPSRNNYGQLVQECNVPLPSSIIQHQPMYKQRWHFVTGKITTGLPLHWQCAMYTMSQKSPTFTTRYNFYIQFDCDNFWHKCCRESRQS